MSQYTKLNYRFIPFTVRILLLTVLLCVSQSGCSTARSFRDSVFGPRSTVPEGGAGGRIGKHSRVPEETEAKEARTLRAPFEIWPFSRDLNGQPLKNLNLLKGDQNFEVGNYAEAQTFYQAAVLEGLDPAEMEAAVIRMASASLLQEDPKAALTTLSDYFRTSGLRVEDVKGRFALLFAYAYGSQANTAQALAWFSRTYLIGAGQGMLADAVRSGLRYYLRTVPSSEFYELSQQWKSDVIVLEMIGQESRRRAAPDYQQPPTQVAKFWEVFDSAYQVATSGGAASGKIGVLVPLSGRFAGLGQSLKNGVELALLGQEGGSRVEAIYRDTQGDALAAEAQIRELATVQGVSAVLGPLLSSVADTASRVAREHSIPMLVFSKRSYFGTGGGVFRLGPTFYSQVRSLIEGCRTRLGIDRFAMVVPSTEVGEEYAAVFRETAEVLGASVVYNHTYFSEGDSTYVDIARQVEESGAQAVFFPDTLVKASRFYQAFSPEAKSKIRLLGSAGWDNPAELARSRALLEGAVFVSPFFAQSDRPLIAKFVEAYKNKFGTEPDFLAAQGFDAATLVMAGLERKEQFSLSFEEALGNISAYEGLTGNMHVGRDGEIDRKFPIVQLYQGRLQEIVEVADQTLLGENADSFVYRGNTEVKTTGAASRPNGNASTPLSEDSLPY